jgi:spermidine synthase
MALFGTVFEIDTAFNHYVVADTIYGGRPARVLYSGAHDAAQSGLALDGRGELLFDYNERFMELARSVRPRTLLVLGGGAFTLPTALAREFPGMDITVVEIDGALVDIARKYFDFEPNEHMEVFIGDARHFLDETDKTFDMVIIDVFTHATIPETFQTHETARVLGERVGKNGVVAMNIIAALEGQRSDILRRVSENFQAEFLDVRIFPAKRDYSAWAQHNYIVTAQRGTHDLAPYMAYPPVVL